jgi:polyisoprenoid-binding protein YceI
MKFFRFGLLLLNFALMSEAVVSQSPSDRTPPMVNRAASNEALDSTAASAGIPSAVDTVRYRLDASQSKFIAHALRGGLFWFMGHEHLVAVPEFTGEAQFTSASITASSLQISAKAASMVETSSAFTDQQKQIINKELREIVLLPDKYPDIIFRSNSVTGKTTASGEYKLKMAGELTLHGITRPVTIETRVTITGTQLRARGEFSINRSDFQVKATTALHGLVRVRNKIKFTFDILGRQE